MTRSLPWLASGAVVAMTVWACAASPADAQLESSAPAPAATASAAAAAPTVSAAPERTGQEILESSCTACHDLGVISTRAATEWPDLVDRMVSYGASISASDHKILIDHLTKTYSTAG